MIITISGMPGSGKTTIAKMIAKKLGLNHYYMGKILRDLAKERGVTLDVLLKGAETDSSADNYVDDYLTRLGKEEDNFIAEGRTAAHFIPHSTKLFIAVDTKVGAERIFKDIKEKGQAAERNESQAKTVEGQEQILKARIASDKKRYMEYYDIDIFNPDLYDLWIDTSDITAEQAASQILAFISENQCS